MRGRLFWLRHLRGMTITNNAFWVDGWWTFLLTLDSQSWWLDPLVWIGIAQTLIFLLQLFVFRNQADKLRETVESGEKQSLAMQDSIQESRRAANAMEAFSKSAQRASNAAAQSTILIGQQMRAYLSVRIDGGFYQDRARNLRFDARPMLINTGLTPARKVAYVASAAVLPFPLLNDFIFPSLEPPRAAFGILAPHQNFIMNACVEDFFPDNEVEEIKRGNRRRLYIWGRVTYEDVSEQERYTEFAHSIIWVSLPNGEERVLGNYLDRHNDAT
jgi:hypothetical protein